MEVLPIVIAVLIFGLANFVGFKTNLLRESNDPKSPYSFSNFQLWWWTVIITPLFVLYWGAGNQPDLNNTGLILLGISGGTILSSSAIAAFQMTKKVTPLKALSKGSVNFLVDILSDDNGKLSVSRLQQLLFTLIYGVIFISSFFKNGSMKYPDFDENAYILMGISSGTYLIAKSMNR